jgi:hypothetical protein
MAGIKCPNQKCGWDGNEPEWEFCGHCGTELTATTSPGVSNQEAETMASVNLIATEASQPVMPPSVGDLPKLIIIRNGRVGHEFVIHNEETSIGRWDSETGSYPEIDLTPDDPDCYISRHHARIVNRDHRYFVEDLGSTNSIVVNKSMKLSPHVPHELQNGDEIIVGKTFLKFVV